MHNGGGKGRQHVWRHEAGRTGRVWRKENKARGRGAHWAQLDRALHPAGIKAGSLVKGKTSTGWKEDYSRNVLCALCLVVQSCPTLCNPMDCSGQALLTMGFSRPEYWSGLPCLPPGDLPNPGIKPRSPELQADSLPSEQPWKSWNKRDVINVSFVDVQLPSWNSKHQSLILNLVYGPPLTFVHDYWKNHSFNYTQTFVSEVISLLFVSLSRPMLFIVYIN